MFLKLRNKFFDRLRNRGFRKYCLSKLFSAVSYTSRNKYLTNGDKIYSNVIQETQADQAIIEVAEETFSNNLGEEPTTMEGNFPVALEEMTTSPINKVGSKTNQMVSYTKQEKPQVVFSLGFVLPGECFELKKDILSIFNEEQQRSCRKSRKFKECFGEKKIVALFKNEKKIGALITKSKL